MNNNYTLTVECPNCTTQIWFHYRGEESTGITCSFCRRKFKIVMDFKLMEIKLGQVGR